MNTGTVGPLAELEPGDIVAGRYRIAERLGNGGMGVVFKAFDEELNDDVVALKLLHRHLAQDETAYRRFRNEVAVARTLTHPNIVRTHDIGRSPEGVSYISMEIVDGESLREQLSRTVEKTGFGFPFEEAVPALFAIISGVAYAHGKGVVHRDLKPANVMLTSDGEYKLADFGTARVLSVETSITRAGQLVGTPDYMAPEQIRGESLDQSCDIYALGIMAFELIAGSKPFAADSPVAVAYKHMHEELPPLDSCGKPAPAWFFSLVKKATAKDKADRFASVEDMAREIANHAPELISPSGSFATQTLLSSASDVAAAKRNSSVENQLPDGEWTLYSEPSLLIEEEAPVEVDSPEEEFVEEPIAFTEVKKGKGLALWLLSPVALVLLASLLVRNVPAVNQKVASFLADSPEVASSTKPVLSLLGLEDSVVSGVDDLVDLDASVEQTKDALEQELLAMSGAEEAVVTDVDEVKEADSAKKTVEKKEESAKKEKESLASAAEQAKKLKEEKVKEAKTEAKLADVSQGADKEVQKVLSSDDVDLSYFRLSFEGSPLRGRQVARKKVSEVKWQASLSGVAKQISNSALAEKFHLNVFNKASQQLLVRVKPSSAKTDGSSRTINGSLLAISSELGEARELRLDAFYDGEMLGASELSLYRAEVKLGGLGSGRSSRGKAAGGSIATIGGGSSSALPKRSAKPVVPKGVQPGLPAIGGTTAKIPSAGNTGGLPSVAATPAAGGLPAARGFATESTLPSASTTTTPSVSAGNRYTFVGTLKGDLATDVRQTLRLSLRERAGGIFGTANFGSRGTFTVTGKDFARGFELNLRAKGVAIRLTGSPSLKSGGESLRGRYSIPSQQKRGAWSASRN